MTDADDRWSPIVLKAQALVFLAIAAAAVALLAYASFDTALLALFGPLTIASANLSLRLWQLSVAARRAILYWMLAVCWLVLIVVLSFDDVTIGGGVVLAATAASIGWVVYVSVQKSLTPS